MDLIKYKRELMLIQMDKGCLDASCKEKLVHLFWCRRHEKFHGICEAHLSGLVYEDDLVRIELDN